MQKDGIVHIFLSNTVKYADTDLGYKLKAKPGDFGVCNSLQKQGWFSWSKKPFGFLKHKNVLDPKTFLSYSPKHILTYFLIKIHHMSIIHKNVFKSQMKTSSLFKSREVKMLHGSVPEILKFYCMEFLTHISWLSNNFYHERKQPTSILMFCQ